METKQLSLLIIGHADFRKNNNKIEVKEEYKNLIEKVFSKYKYTMKSINQFINEAKYGTIDQFFNVISELFINNDFDDFWKTKIKSHFKRNKSIFKAIDYYDKWSDLLDDDLADIYQSRNGLKAKNRMKNEKKDALNRSILYFCFY